MELILKMYSESIWLHNEIYQEKLIILELRILILGMSSESIWPLDETYNEKFNIFRSSVLHVKRCSLHLRSYKPTLLQTMVMEIIVISVKNVPNKSSWREHLQDTHDFGCDICKSGFDSREGLDTRIQDTHNHNCQYVERVLRKRRTWKPPFVFWNTATDVRNVRLWLGQCVH